MMKKLNLIIFLLATAGFAKSQTITSARFKMLENAKGFRSVDLIINDKFLIEINRNGTIDYIESRDGDIYSLEDMKKTGIPIEFYDTHDIHDIPGRIKSIGNIKIAFNNTFDIHDVPGTLKSIGDIDIKYYNTFDIHDPKGKVKYVGNVAVKYYTTFDTNSRPGELKSIRGNSRVLSVIYGRRHWLDDDMIGWE